MDELATLDSLAALSQQTRLRAFRLLVEAEPKGLPAGEIARRLDVPQNTMSAHLSVLARSGLVCSERRSRSIVYRPDLDRFRALVVFMMQDCCGGRPDICAPVVAELSPCCAPSMKRKEKRRA